MPFVWRRERSIQLTELRAHPYFKVVQNFSRYLLLLVRYDFLRPPPQKEFTDCIRFFPGLALRQYWSARLREAYCWDVQADLAGLCPSQEAYCVRLLWCAGAEKE